MQLYILSPASLRSMVSFSLHSFSLVTNAAWVETVGILSHLLQAKVSFLKDPVDTELAVTDSLKL